MPADLRSILKIQVPLIVQIATREMPVEEVMKFSPGAIVELPKLADEELEIMVSNKQIGLGRAVKVGENFGVRVTFVGDIRTRIHAMAGEDDPVSGSEDAVESDDAERLASQLLAGQ